MKKSMQTFIDLFAGVGGFHLALEGLGMKCTFASEIDKNARITYEENFPQNGSYDFVGDIMKVRPKDIPQHDILCGGFPCFGAGTLIVLERGIVPIEDVYVGDMALTHKGRYKKVIRIGKKESDTVLLMAHDTRGTVTTKNHEFYSARREKATNPYTGLTSHRQTHLKWKSLEDLMRLQTEKSNVYVATPRVFPEMLIPRVVSTKNKKNQFKMNKDFFFMVGRNIRDNQTRNVTCKSTPNSLALSRWIHENFDTPKNQTLPAWLLGAPKKFRKAFLEGYLPSIKQKSDNLVTKSECRSKKLSLGISLLCQSLGYSTDRVYSCHSYGEWDMLQKRELYVNYIWKKPSTSWTSGKNQYNIVHQVLPTGKSETVYDFTVEDDHSYIADGFIVHNCQPFSIAGAQLGFEHEHGNLFFSIAKILKVKKPEVIFLENVKNLASHDNGQTFKIILSTLKKLGYHVKWTILNASTHGNLPQNRERTFIVGFRTEAFAEAFAFPKEISLTKKLFGDIINIRKKQEAKYYMTDTKSPSVKKMLAGITEKNHIYQYRRYYIRINRKKVCPTLTANMGTGGHNVPLLLDSYGVRKLTPRECFSIQGYPTTFKLPEISDSALYKQAGNSVPVPVIQRIAKNILAVLNGKIFPQPKKSPTQQKLF